MTELSKHLKKQFRELIGIAYKRELAYHLNELAKKFDEWKAKKIDCWELNDLIHQFHNGISRDVYNTYNNNLDKRWLVSRAIANNFLQWDEVPQEVLDVTTELTNHLLANKE